MSIGPIIRQLRSEQNLSITQLSAKIGISPTSLRLYETDVRKPKKNTLNKIAEILDVNPMIFSETNDSANNAVLTLIDLLKKHGGEIYSYNDIKDSSNSSLENRYFWTFDNIPVYSFYNAYRKFQEGINRAKECNDAIKMAHQIIEAEKEFQSFIDTFPLLLTDSEKEFLELKDNNHN